MDDLTLQVRLVDRVEVDDAERADARRGQVKQRRRAEAARAHDEHLRVLQALLPGHADVGDDQVARVALHLIDRQVRGRFNQRWQRHRVSGPVVSDTVQTPVRFDVGDFNEHQPGRGGRNSPRRAPRCPRLRNHLTEQGRDDARALHLREMPRLRQHLHAGVAEGAGRPGGQPRMHQAVIGAEQDEGRRRHPPRRPPQRERRGPERLADQRARGAGERRGLVAERVAAAQRRRPRGRTGPGAGATGRRSRSRRRRRPGSPPGSARDHWRTSRSPTNGQREHGEVQHGAADLPVRQRRRDQGERLHQVGAAGRDPDRHRAAHRVADQVHRRPVVRITGQGLDQPDHGAGLRADRVPGALSSAAARTRSPAGQAPRSRSRARARPSGRSSWWPHRTSRARTARVPCSRRAGVSASQSRSPPASVDHPAGPVRVLGSSRARLPAAGRGLALLGRRR